jgi:hypothetical protein
MFLLIKCKTHGFGSRAVSCLLLKKLGQRRGGNQKKALK